MARGSQVRNKQVYIMPLSCFLRLQRDNDLFIQMPLFYFTTPKYNITDLKIKLKQAVFLKFFMIATDNA